MAPITRQQSAQSSTVKSVYKVDKEDEKMVSLLKRLNLKIDKNHVDIGAKIDLISTNHRNEVLQNLHEMESKMDDKLTKSLASNALQVDHLSDIVENNERIAKLNDVILRGIPLNHQENLVTIFEQISFAIGFESKCSAVNVIIRLKSGTDQTTSPILVKFVSAILKRDFMSKYYMHRELKLSVLGLDSQDRIYASDNLTKRNFVIQLEAVKMLKDKKISKIHTRSGLVYVKFNGSVEFTKINCLDELNLMSQNVNQSAVEKG